MATFCPTCAEAVSDTSVTCTFCGQQLSPSRPSAAPITSAPREGVPGSVTAHAAPITQPLALPPATQPLAANPTTQPLALPPTTQPLATNPTTQPLAPPKLRNPNTAFYLEFLGLIGFLGIGHLYAERAAVGLILLFGWLVCFFGGMVVFSLIAGVVAAFTSSGFNLWAVYFPWLFVPALGASWLSALNARGYVRRQQGL
ncbi:MAG: hypothetical protein AB4911_14625 [Oscillochloridaceae bacterium umkhey_bin13]